MATYFIDLDKIFSKSSISNLSKKKADFINKLTKKGQIAFYTQKSLADSKSNLNNPNNELKNFGIKCNKVIEEVLESKVVIDDEGIQALSRRMESLNHKARIRQNIFRKKSYNMLSAIAWASWKFLCQQTWDDCDDYIQTLAVARSLIENNGFNHRDLVEKYREEPLRRILIGKTMNRFCMLPFRRRKYRGQIMKLLNSPDPLYMANDGITDGSAMKVAPIAIFYSKAPFKDLISATDKITRVTHNTVDGRLAAILTVLRYQQVLQEPDDNNIENLLRKFKAAIKIIGVEQKSRFFTKKVELAARLTNEEKNPTWLFLKLVKEIGMMHVAWSTPVTACFWSFRAGDEQYDWLSDDWLNEKAMPRRNFLSRVYYQTTIDGLKIDNKFVKPKILKEAQRRFLEFNPEDKEYHLKILTMMDIGTFSHISYGIIAARKGLDRISNEVEEAVNTLDLCDNLKQVFQDLSKTPKKSTYFIDFDGVFFKYGTLTPTKGAVNFVNHLKKRGNQIIFVTKRLYKNNNDPKINLYETEKILKKLGVKYDKIIGNISSPRVFVNDKNTIIINHKRNDPLENTISSSPIILYFKKEKKTDLIIKRIIIYLWMIMSGLVYYIWLTKQTISVLLKKYSPSLHKLLKSIKSKIIH